MSRSQPVTGSSDTDEVKRLYWSVGQVAKALGVTASKLRFYEAEFKMHVHRWQNGDRAYTVTQMGRMALIVRLMEYGTLESTREALRRGIGHELLKVWEPKIAEPVTGHPMRIFS